MIETLECKFRKARKEYTCDFCGGKIFHGETYIFQKLIDNDNSEIYNWKSHIKCDYIATNMDVCNGYEFIEACREYLKEFICLYCEMRDKDFGSCDGLCDRNIYLEKIYNRLKRLEKGKNEN